MFCFCCFLLFTNEFMTTDVNVTHQKIIRKVNSSPGKVKVKVKVKVAYKPVCNCSSGVMVVVVSLSVLLVRVVHTRSPLSSRR